MGLKPTVTLRLLRLYFQIIATGGKVIIPQKGPKSESSEEELEKALIPPSSPNEKTPSSLRTKENSSPGNLAIKSSSSLITDV